MNHGVFKKFHEKDERLSNLFVSMLNKIDIKTESFSDSTGNYQLLFCNKFNSVFWFEISVDSKAKHNNVHCKVFNSHISHGGNRHIIKAIKVVCMQ